MPSSKRAKKVSLTKTKKKPAAEARSSYVDALRSSVEGADAVYVVGIDAHARPTKFKALRASLPGGSSLTLGKKTLMRLALGDSEETELKPGLRTLTEAIEGGHAILATSAPRSDVEACLAAAVAPEFATAGFVAPATVRLERGPLDAAKFPVSMHAALKKLDLPVEVSDSKLDLVDDWRCATAGRPLTPAQAKMLEHLDMRVHEFKPVIVKAYVGGAVTA
mmetsp:Transcript_2199/g.6644  ORF Transcript_2199/g.6644 Transcript_2199/m.6644 type:complete len:221 (+) Transcript_2199:228-890(+)